MDMQMIVALTIFIVSYIFIATEKINKIVVALAGAVLMILLGFIDQKAAFSEFIDWNVIFLLIGMMIMVGVVKRTGIFEYIAVLVAKKAKGDPKKIMLILFVVTAFFSSFLDNVTTIVVLIPISILIAVELKISPIPFVISQTIAGMIGGASTLIGDPSNLMIGSAAGKSFTDFLQHITLFIAFLVVVSSGVIYLFFRKQLVVSNERRARIMEFDEKPLITDKSLLIYGGFVFVIFLGMLIFQEKLGLHAATIALFSAVLLLFRAKSINIEHFINNDIDWNTILFFCGLFTMVGALERTGVIALVSDNIVELTHGNIKLTSISLLWTTGIAAAFLDNVPFAAATIPVVHNITDSLVDGQCDPIWWSFVLGACLGGTGTLIGCTANIVAVGISKKSGYPVSFWTFTKYGAVITLINLTLATGFILLRYFYFV